MTLFFLCILYLRLEQSSKIKKYANEIIDSLFITSDNVKLCKQSHCIEAIKNEVKTYRSFIVIYKEHEKWRVQRNRKKNIALINSYHGANLILWQGNAKVKGIELDNEEQVIVLA